ncbi:MAG: SRPBCC family protein [Defluviimonas sp.]|uniref:SRPBCC family protein n=1 Tax=Albidovulum sp. TaxID=1872424 RepID=UPI001DBBB25C|nr:SRPBCC family protein [Paracoccaceae bacterium]MCC0065309.1 SRPBCC family protein [Defluviimonas sp.]
MKFSTREDIEAPAEEVFAALSDFEGFERAALRRGAEVTRNDPTVPVARGAVWNLRFPLRGKMRRLLCEMTEYDAPRAMRFAGQSTGYTAQLDMALLALSKSRTRIAVELEIRPRTLPARLLLQSVRLSKASYARRFEARVQKFAIDLELKRLKPGLF